MANNFTLRLPMADNKGFNDQKLDAFYRQIEEFVNNIRLTSDNINTAELDYTLFSSTFIDTTKLTSTSSQIGVRDGSFSETNVGVINDVTKIAPASLEDPHMMERSVGTTGTAGDVTQLSLNNTTLQTALGGNQSLTPPAKTTFTQRGRPCMIFFTPDSTGTGKIQVGGTATTVGTDLTWRFGLFIDDVQVEEWAFRIEGNDVDEVLNVPATYKFFLPGLTPAMWFPSTAGTNTVELKINNGGDEASVLISNMIMNVVEL